MTNHKQKVLLLILFGLHSTGSGDWTNEPTNRLKSEPSNFQSFIILRFTFLFAESRLIRSLTTKLA